MSEALGLVGGKIVNHGKRVAYMALCLADIMDLAVEDRFLLRNAALLHDAGVSSTLVHEKLKELDWEGADEHCRDGALLLMKFPRFERVAEIVRLHHHKWDNLIGSPVDEKTALLANIIFLADRVDVLIDWASELILNRDSIEPRIEELVGTYFNPQTVDAFRKISQVEVFWLSLYPRHLPQALAHYQSKRNSYLALDDLEVVAGIFAKIVDNKSRYTKGHSFGVANLCHHLASAMNLPFEKIQKLRIAGLLHDLGKLSVPDHILEKPSMLTQDEFQIVKRHPFETYYILSSMPALAEIRDWAAFHHEKMDGSGYPFHRSAEDFSVEHLIVMVSDIIQALIQDRPYRPGLAQDQVLDILEYVAHHQPAFRPLTEVIRRDYKQLVIVATEERRAV